MGAFRDAIWGAKNGDSKAVELLYALCSRSLYIIFPIPSNGNSNVVFFINRKR